jgi:Ser/Thr protein kinase RdoA (MazF antagonist)
VTTATAEPALAEARSLLAEQGLACARIEPLAPPGSGRRAGRWCLRVTTEDGRTWKLRRLESAAEAARLAALRGRVDAPFLPAMTQMAVGAAFLAEPWIEGEPLSPAQAEARAEELGALLGRLHAASPGAAAAPGAPADAAAADAAARAASAERAERARADLAELARSGRLPGGEAGARRLRELLDAAAPAAVAAARSVLVHRDFCPENIVLDRAGRLHVVDHEWLGLDAAGVDLGRTWSRWDATDDAWQRFLRGYAATAPRARDGAAGAPPGLRFWLVAMAARGARVNPRRELPLRRLRELAA